MLFGGYIFRYEIQTYIDIAPSLGAFLTPMTPRTLHVHWCFPMRIPQGIGTRHIEMDFQGYCF